MNKVKRFIITVAMVCVCAGAVYAASIVNSKHNMSSTGPGSVKAVTESQVCIFCHTPHDASSAAPLWNRYDSGRFYIPYASSTLKATVGQPTGASKLCLSCHDGTVALGMVRSRKEAITFTHPLGGEQNLGTDLSDDHPISFRYDSSLAFSNTQLKDPSVLEGRVRLDKDSQLQCTSCHDPHDNQYGKFLKVDGVRGALCLACHVMDGWDRSAHKDSTAYWNGMGPNPWPNTPWKSVADNACENCHASHGASGKKRLLTSATEEGNCIACHNGDVARKNIFAEFNKLSVHPIYENTGMHDPTEEYTVDSKRHVECVDCHNPHASSGVKEGPLSGSLRKVKGVNSQGIAVDEIAHEYELCFRCHADSDTAVYNYVNRQHDEHNTRVEFDPTNASFHPILNTGKNPDVPSLIAPLTTASMIKCTDCHGNDSGLSVGGAGPNGPHGSVYRPILERNYNIADNQQESLTAYALCYKCHDRNSILLNRSFPKHRRHIINYKSPCSACHDPHGVKNSTHLINFDRNIVSPSQPTDDPDEIVDQPIFSDNGRFHGTCILICHGRNHNNARYSQY